MRDERAYLYDVIESARMIQQFIAGRTYDEFLNDILLREAVLRRIGIIGEAARMLSDNTKGAAPEIPWIQVIQMRNVLIHVYFGINYEIVWKTVTEDLNTLIIAVERILATRFPTP
jgi:uncharacterized protein with HEPN domain